MSHSTTFGAGRRTLLKALAAGTILSPLGFAASAQDISGELVMINWLGGAQAEMMDALQADFVEKNPEVSFRNIVPTSSGDTRGGIRTVLLGGEQADILINTWPAFRQELLDAGMIQPSTRPGTSTAGPSTSRTAGRNFPASTAPTTA